MENVNNATNIDNNVLLVDGEILSGTVKRPFIQDGKLMGAILAFEGRSETALLHRKQMSGSNKNERLANFKLGDVVTVKLLVSGERPNRRTWASEANIDDTVIVDRMNAEKPKRISGKIVNATDYGVFVELQSGVSAGRRGLIHAKNMCRGGAPSLGSFTSYTPGADINVDVLGAHIDDKGGVRIDLAPAAAA